MEIKQNKFKRFFKRFGVLSVACVFAFALALTLTLSLSKDKKQPVGVEPMQFGLPMTNATIVKDYAEERLQYNQTLNRWEAHLALDLVSDEDDVFSISDGVVSLIDSDSLSGNFIEIEHADGFVSVYSSLSDELLVKEGDRVVGGQLIGKASNSASNEMKDGGHLHFIMFKDGEEVDPNNYLDLQNK